MLKVPQDNVSSHYGIEKATQMCALPILLVYRKPINPLFLDKFALIVDLKLFFAALNPFLSS